MDFELWAEGFLVGIPLPEANELKRLIQRNNEMICSDFPLDKQDPNSLGRAQIMILHAIDKHIINRQTLVRLNEKSAQIACKTGCNHCCYQRVPVNACQAFLIVGNLHRELEVSQFEFIKREIRQKAKQAVKMKEQDWEMSRVGCPLLQEGKCITYDFRPTACRGFNSISERACRERLEGLGNTVELDIVQRAMAALFEGHYRVRLDSLEVDSRRLELVSALDTILNTPMAMERWLAGDMVLFQDCVDALYNFD